MQNETTCRDECSNSRYCHKSCPKSGDYMDCCHYWHFEEIREDARRDEAYEKEEREKLYYEEEDTENE